MNCQYLETLLSRLICSNEEKIIFSLAECDEIPLKFIQFLQKESLLRQRKNVTTIRCKECEEKCIEQVHYHELSQQPYIYCKEEGYLSISFDELLLWEFSFSNLTQKIYQLCQCKGNIKTLGNIKWYIGLIDGKKHKGETILEYIPSQGMMLSVNGYPLPLLEVLFIKNNNLSMDLKKLILLADKSKKTQPTTTVKQDARKQKTEERNKAWEKMALEINEENPRLSTNQIAEKISRTELGKGVKPATIARNLRNVIKK